MEAALQDVQVFPPKEFLNTSGRPGLRTAKHVRLWTVKEHIQLFRTVERALAQKVSPQDIIEQEVPSKLNVAPSDVLEYLIGLNFPVKDLVLTQDESMATDKRRLPLHSLGYKRRRKNKFESDLSDGSLDAESIRAVFKKGPLNESTPRPVPSEPTMEPTTRLALLRGPMKS